MHVHLSLNSVSPPEIRTIVSQTFTDLKSKEDPENFRPGEIASQFQVERSCLNMI